MSVETTYAVVTPARDEAANIGELADALFAQTAPFSRWVVVDDGSTDGTQDIVRPLVDLDSRVTLIERPGLRKRRVGTAGIEATVAGMSTLSDFSGFDYVANIDADITFAPDYFERLFAKFDADPRLGIAGGYCYSRTPQGLALDKGPDDHVHGATKVYRTECLRDIWPLAEVWGWDAVDEGRAQMAGWRTRSFAEPSITHCKPMSGGTGRLLQGKYVFGRTCHFLGYRADFALLRAALNAGRPPYVLGGLAMGWGYLSGVLTHAEQIDDPDFISYLRARQGERMRAALSPRLPRGRTAR